MKIILFEDLGRLNNYLLSRKTSVSVLNFMGAEGRLKIASDNIAHPACPDAHEAESVVSEYVEVISDIGSLNQYSLYWLCHPISEKNDLNPNNLFSQLVEFLAFYKFITAFKEEELAILTSSKALIKNITDFSKAYHVNCELSDNQPYSKTFQTVMKRFSALYSDIQFFWREFSHSRKTRFLFRRLDRRKSYVVIRTWFDHRSKAFINQGRDVYYGILPGLIKDRGKNILYYGGILNCDFDDLIKKDLKKCLQNPILVDDALLSWLDYFKAGLFRCKCRYKIKLPDKITIHGVDTNFIFKNYFNAGLRSTYIAKHYLIYLAAKKLLRKVQIDHFFNLFENYAWEKVTTLAIRENPKKIKLTAFQHAQVAQSSTKFFLGKKESRCSPLPDKIVTLGEITRDFLVNQKKYPDDVTVTGCALRHNYPDVSGIIPRKHHNRILVFLWTFEYSIRLLNFLCSCNIPQDRYAITVRPHPTLPFDALKPRLGREYNGIFRISNRSLKKDFARTDIVVYSGTTSCLDALASGLPVINIEFGDFVSPDPLFCFSDFKWTVNKPDELESAFESIYKLTDSEYYSRQAKAFDFVRKYFYAVNNQNLQVFFE